MPNVLTTDRANVVEVDAEEALDNVREAGDA